MKFRNLIFLFFLLMVYCGHINAQSQSRQLFNDNWSFQLDSVHDWHLGGMAETWKPVALPHDWSIYLPFDSLSPTGTDGGALRGGIGWYKKKFIVSKKEEGKQLLLDFDGVYCNSQVYVNGRLVGERPNGYISFRYDITPYLSFGKENTIVVKVNNSPQPNSRWYSGSGIYRNVWLSIASPLHVAYNGNYIKPVVADKGNFVNVKIQTSIVNKKGENYFVKYRVKDDKGNFVLQKQLPLSNKSKCETEISIQNPIKWTLEKPRQYSLQTIVCDNSGKEMDVYYNKFGVRSFRFDTTKGFLLNGKSVKILGVCMHHDMGALGTAYNRRAIERQLQILKTMGVNGIRTSHNPPTPELLDMCDSMGFVVMAESFDMWKIEKTTYDYHLNWDRWHKQDLEDFIVRDRNHPSIFMWSVGNEIPEQGYGSSHKDTSGRVIIRELVKIVKNLDDRPTVTANNHASTNNNLLIPKVTDLVGYNYSHKLWDSASIVWSKPFIVTESVSALQTRGHYDMPSDSIRIWPARWDAPMANGNKDLTCSAYENCATPWGSTHEQSIKALLGSPSVSGMYIWTGFDYIGEPTPYPWSARSSYFGILDLAGFPKDAYYLYKSLFTKDTVLHIFPHWNWKLGQKIDVWAYYNNADEVELFVNGKSQGIKKKQGDDLKVVWNLVYQPGTIKAISRKNGKIVAVKIINTAGDAYKIVLKVDRNKILADAKDLAFITVSIEDKKGNIVPTADNRLHFDVEGEGALVATDNGLQTDLDSFQTKDRKAFNGLALGIVKSTKKKGKIVVKVSSDGLIPATINIEAK